MSDLLCQPHPHQLRRMSDQLKVVEGGGLIVYSIFQEEVQERKGDKIEETVGYLMLDKIKLKIRLYATDLNKVTGF